MSRRVNREDLERDNAHSDDSEAIEVKEDLLNEEENLPPVEEGSDVEDLEENMDRDYRPEPLLDQYERQSADEEQYSDMDSEQLQRANEVLDERDDINRRRNRRQGHGIRERLLDFLDEDSSDLQHYGQRFQMRQYQEDQDMKMESEEEEEEKFQEEKFLDRDNVKGKLSEWIQEDRTVRYIKYQFKKFLRSFKREENQSKFYYVEKIKEMCQQNKQSLNVEFRDLQEKESMKTLLIWIIYEPALIFPLLNKALKEVVLKLYPEHENVTENYYIKIANFLYNDSLRDLRHKNVGSLIQVQGVVTKRSQVYSQLYEVVYSCRGCGQKTEPVLDTNPDQKKIGRCRSCQMKDNYKIDYETTIYRNFQKITLQESPGSVPAGRVPTSKEVILLGDNIDVCRPGDEVQVTGIYTYRYDYILNVKHGFPLFATMIEANYVKCLADVQNIEIEPQELKEIQKWASRPDIKDVIINSVAPSIHGHFDIKTALALAMFGGESKQIGDQHRTRGDINVLICGDPGVAKSQFLKSVQKTFQRTVYTTGKGATAVGLTASVKRDTETKEWTLEGGALVLADQGICLIDEFDKMNDYDRTSIHEAMEQQSISISKAGIVASLQARCSVIAASNPKTGRYDSTLSFMDNVDFTDPIISRFDILCVVKDEVNPEYDYNLATFVINSHIKSHPIFSEFWKQDFIKFEANEKELEDESKIEQENEYQEEILNLKNLRDNLKETLLEETAQEKPLQMPQELLKKYIIHAKTFHPKITQIDKDKIKNFYVELRQSSQQLGGITIAVRHIESLIRMAESFAKMSLRNEVKGEDVDRAISVLLKSFIQSQKSAISKKIADSFKKYLIDKKDNQQILHSILNELMLSTQQSHFRGDKIAIPLKTFSKRAELYKIGNISDYLQSEQFKTLYIQKGEIIQYKFQDQQQQQQL